MAVFHTSLVMLWVLASVASITEFQKPQIKCPLAEEGRESSIECTIQVPHEATFTRMCFESRGANGTYCKSTASDPSDRYEASIPESPQTSNVSASLKIKNVEISDNTIWRCKVELENVSVELTAECNMTVYSPPEKPVCWQTFANSSVVITCTTRRVYPQAACDWSVNGGAISQSDTQDIKSYTAVGEYYSTNCVLTYKLHRAGRYTFNVVMYPDITEPEFSEERAERSGSLTVEIETLRISPVFVSPAQPGRLQTLFTEENRTTVLSCQVHGGRPPVYQTNIKCPGGVFKSASGPVVTANIRLTRSMNSQFCVCSAYHILPYSKTAYLRLVVYFPPQITTFEVNNKKNEILEIDSGQIMTMKCFAEGNPAPTVTLYQVHNDSIVYLESSLTTVTYSMVADCRHTGTYRCAARNTFNSSYIADFPRTNVRVRCPPEHCDSGTLTRTFGVAVNTDITVKICVLAYPEPTALTLYQENMLMPRERYNASFQYTNYEHVEGEIILTIYAFKESDLRFYMLTSNGNEFSTSRVEFQLVRQGPPSCPTEFAIESVTTDSLILSWRPGFDGGRPQTFVLLRFLGEIPQTDHVILEKVNHSNEARLSYEYNVTKLSASTFYKFGIYVENDLNITECPELQAVEIKKVSPEEGDKNFDIYVGVGTSAVGFITVVIVIIIIMIRKRRTRTASLKPSKTDNTELNLIQTTDHMDY